jgi:primosomal protein N' (replication factor Y)
MRPGCRVRVRFRERRLIGIVVECVTETGFREPREFGGHLHTVEQVVDVDPVLSSTMISILRDTAREVLCPVGIALHSALPAGSAPRNVKGHAITPRGREAMRSAALRDPEQKLLAAVADGPRSVTALRRVGGDGTDAALDGLTRDGFLTTAGIEKPPRARGATKRMAALCPGIDLESALSNLARAPVQAALLRRIAEQAEIAVDSLQDESRDPGPALRSLVQRGLVEIQKRSAPRNVLGTALESGRSVTLTNDQADAIKPIADAVRGRRAETFLLHGVTGSGKTEVYLRVIAEALEQGRQALVLVPEITLTHQILARIRGRFGDNLAVLHSGLRPGERVEQWQRLQAGATPIAVGARSALFAPLENLGVIVIDEEHDTAYKNEEGFRYHARDLALRRASQAGCPVILGTATPSIETRYAADHGDTRRLVLAHRIGNRPLPAVSIVDLAAERERTSNRRRGILSPPLQQGIERIIAEGGQTLLLLNRRGFSTQVMCFDCGNAWRCEHCDITLVYHASDRRLRCHYCDYQIEPPDRCPHCGSGEAALMGFGTQRLEEEVRSQFPKARLARLDRDTAQRRGATEEILRSLREGELDIVIGTQIIAKGHDFPGVRLVGVVLADIGLHLPDFRAAERTFQLLTQVAGRAGREKAPGQVIIQTFSPDHYAIRPVRNHDYESFYAEELSHRSALRYPPFGWLVHAVISAEDESAAGAGAAQLAAALSSDEDESLELLGPAPCPLARLRGRYRFQLLVKAVDLELRQQAAARLVAAAEELPTGVTGSVDSNPMNML